MYVKVNVVVCGGHGGVLIRLSNIWIDVISGGRPSLWPSGQQCVCPPYVLKTVKLLNRFCTCHAHMHQ